ncbi:unnamed protein product [Arctia plantaginis]|uniref:HAT C-terminal dimerisation domain-containing protein n=1 Tax=Arctia plantaginis TaxID=874455 RepID=A0A8S1A3I0_ARCPL|nr:unnamed protein product [Arctia plantaginis]
MKQEQSVTKSRRDIAIRPGSGIQKNNFAYAKLPQPLRTDEKKHIDLMLLKLIAKTYQPFSIVEETDFVEFVEALNPNYVLPERKVISEKLIPFLYNRCLEDLKTTLYQEASTVCLTIDCWTSIKIDSFISITAHFINNDFEFKSFVLKCTQINGAHTCQNLASILREACVEWGITEKINFCVTDNASNIVGAINILGWTHYGCMAHKLNQILHHSLKEFDVTLKKVKEIVTYFSSSCKAKEKLLEYQAKVQGSSQPLVLINSVPTRWNSIYFMIERFVNLQDSIRATTPNVDVDLPILLIEEWTALRQLCKVLKPFEEATKELSVEKYVSASKAIAVINGLKDVLLEVKQKPAYYDSIKSFIECIEEQLEMKFKGIELNESLALCTILDPRYKMSMFLDEAATERAKSSLVNKVQDLLTDEIGSPSELPVKPVLEASISRADDENISLWRKRNLIIKKRRINPTRNLLQLAQQEVDTYLQDEFAQNNCDPCFWWRSGQYKYPHLAKLFKKNSNIVASSVPSERLFSKAGYTLSERRTRLSARKTEQLVFLNTNLKSCDYKNLMP